jgi:predicted lysophospholipase L1 biosynthesis ABC-type transport system permease subunit
MSSPTTGPGQDWPSDIAGRIESVVGAVRDRTTVPATFVARVLVYGLVAGVLGAALGIFLVLGLVRLLDVYLPFHPIGRRVWVVDAAASAIFLGSGAFLWRRRRPRQA